MDEEPVYFKNFYRCPNDGTEWVDEWSCTCNDRCPTCNAEIEPYRSEDVEYPSAKASGVGKG